MVHLLLSLEKVTEESSPTNMLLTLNILLCFYEGCICFCFSLTEPLQYSKLYILGQSSVSVMIHKEKIRKGTNKMHQNVGCEWQLDSLSLLTA